MQLTKQDAEAEAIRRWYELPADMRQTPDDAEIFAAHIAPSLDIPSLLEREKLLGDRLMRELIRTRQAEKDAAAKTQAA